MDYEKSREILVSSLISSLYKVKLKQGFLGLKNKIIPTKTANLGWTEAGILTEPGIFDEEKQLYFSGTIYLDVHSQQFPIETRPDKYGYRLGCSTEAEELGLSGSKRRVTALLIIDSWSK